MSETPPHKSLKLFILNGNLQVLHRVRWYMWFTPEGTEPRHINVLLIANLRHFDSTLWPQSHPARVA